MLSSAKIGRSSWRYYQRTVAGGACEYFTGHSDAPGRWHGSGLDALGLAEGGEVAERELEALFGRALSPSTGAALGRAWRADAVTGFDLTFSAPKSVSALWALGDPTTVTAIDASHTAAVKAALGYLQAHASVSRRGRDGVEQIASAGYAAALFDHHTSRTGDPQLHTHALVVNKVQCTDGVWRTLDGHEIYHHKKSAGVLYQAALRAELTSRLGIGFTTVSEHGQAEITGVPDELLEGWSTRTTAVMADAVPTLTDAETALGRDLTPAERARIIKTAVLSTRPVKDHDVSEGDLRQRWQLQATGWGWDRERVQSAMGAPTSSVPKAFDEAGRWSNVASRPDQTLPTPVIDHPARNTTAPESHVIAMSTAVSTAPVVAEADVIALSIAHTSPLSDAELAEAVLAAGRSKAIWSRADLTSQVAARLTPTPGSSGVEVVQQVEALTDRALDGTGHGAVPLGEVADGVTARASDARYASQELVNTEARILERALTHGFRSPFRIPATVIDTALASTPVVLSAQQQQAAIRLVGSRDLVTVMSAPAGAGKTTTLAAAVGMWQGMGRPVTTLAPSARAASELATATGTHGRTVASWLLAQRREEDHHGGPRAPVRWLGAQPVVIVDEASMLSTTDLDHLTSYLYRAGGSLVLVGDAGQIGAVNAPGGMFDLLTHRFGPWTIELTELHRYQHPWEASATLRLREGDATVLTQYAHHGRVHPAATGEDAADAVFTQWQEATDQGKDALMLARAWSDVTALNTRARAVAIATGVITGPDLTVIRSRTPSTHGRAEARGWRAGDVLIAKKNTTEHRIGADPVRNGDRFRVLGATPGAEGQVGGLVVEDLAGRGRTTLPSQYLAKYAEYGWASTIDGAQGATADIGIVLARSGLDREHLYVAMTRGREANHVHTTPELQTGDAGPHRHQHQHQHQRPEQAEVAGTARVTELETMPRSPRPVRTETAGQLELLARSDVTAPTERVPPPTPGDMDAALRQLSHAVQTSGRERAAHTRLHPYVDRAREQAWVRQDATHPALPVPEDHQRRERQLRDARTHRDWQNKNLQTSAAQLRDVENALALLPFWSRRRRQALTHKVTGLQGSLRSAATAVEHAQSVVDDLAGHVAADAQQRITAENTAQEQRYHEWSQRPQMPYREPIIVATPTPQRQDPMYYPDPRRSRTHGPTRSR